MGWFIQVFPEKRNVDRYEIIPDLKIFDWRFYGMFAFLGGFKDDTGIPPLAEARGIPADSILYESFSSWHELDDRFGMSWLSVRELLDFDYDQTFVGTFRVIDPEEDGNFLYMSDAQASTAMTFRHFLGQDFFNELARLAASNADRIIFFYC